MSTKTLEIMQLADSCFPSGGFAFSNGLECMAKLGYVKRMPDFEQYLECYLDQLMTADLPFLNSAYAAAKGFGQEMAPQLGDSVLQFIQVSQDWNAWLFLPAQRRGSLAQGQAWLRAVEETYSTLSLKALRKIFLDGHLEIHFLMVLAASLAWIGIPLEEAQTLLIHMALRDQLGAAVRLGLLGSLQAQKLHFRFITYAEHQRQQYQDWVYTAAQRSSPMIELAQASHTHLYSRLFQS